MSQMAIIPLFRLLTKGFDHSCELDLLKLPHKAKRNCSDIKHLYGTVIIQVEMSEFLNPKWQNSHVNKIYIPL